MIDPANEPEEERVYGPGAWLDWFSPVEKVSLVCELPFWLLMPESRLSVSQSAFETNVEVVNSGVEIQTGHQYTRSWFNTVFVGPRERSQEERMTPDLLISGTTHRATRTLLRIEAFAVSDAVRALIKGSGPWHNDGARYFAALCAGHIPVLNVIINAYRSATIDPLASEVTSWDVPNWFVLTEKGARSICLHVALVEDWFPRYRSSLDSEELLPRIACDEGEVREMLSNPRTPGEIEFLDGWSLFHRGRYGDSIRSFVTGIEVLVESEVSRLMRESGKSSVDIAKTLEATRSNFDSRLNLYCELSRRRVPGPKLDAVPWLNGLRLREDLQETRRVRHQIVHHGHRLDHRFRGRAQRAAETMSWLFDWIAENGFEERRGSKFGVFAGFNMASFPFATRTVRGRIAVDSRRPPTTINDARNRFLFGDEFDGTSLDGLVLESFKRVVHHPAQLWRTIDPRATKKPDIEHFAKMCLYELGLPEVEDSPFRRDEPPVAERFRLTSNGRTAAIFVLNLPSEIRVDELRLVAGDVETLRRSGESIDQALVIANEFAWSEFNQRSSQIAVDFDGFATANGLTVVPATSLGRIVLGVLYERWNDETVRSSLLAGGCQCADPPGSRFAGRVYQAWTGAGVVGVALRQDITITDGDVLAIEYPTRYLQFRVSSPRTDDRRQCTFQCPIPRKNGLIGARVFVLSNRSFRPSQEEDGDGLGLSESRGGTG